MCRFGFVKVCLVIVVLLAFGTGLFLFTRKPTRQEETLLAASLDGFWVKSLFSIVTTAEMQTTLYKLTNVAGNVDSVPLDVVKTFNTNVGAGNGKPVRVYRALPFAKIEPAIARHEQFDMSDNTSARFAIKWPQTVDVEPSTFREEMLELMPSAPGMTEAWATLWNKRRLLNDFGQPGPGNSQWEALNDAVTVAKGQWDLMTSNETTQQTQITLVENGDPFRVTADVSSLLVDPGHPFHVRVRTVSAVNSFQKPVGFNPPADGVAANANDWLTAEAAITRSRTAHFDVPAAPQIVGTSDDFLRFKVIVRKNTLTSVGLTDSDIFNVRLLAKDGDTDGGIFLPYLEQSADTVTFETDFSATPNWESRKVSFIFDAKVTCDSVSAPALTVRVVSRSSNMTDIAPFIDMSLQGDSIAAILTSDVSVTVIP